MSNSVETQATAESASLFARLWRELMQTPTFREACRIQLRETERPPATAETVRAVLWSDIDLSLSAAVTLPRLISSLTAALAELGRQLSALPPGLRQAFIANILTEIEQAKFQDAAAAWSPLWRETIEKHPELRALMSQAMTGVAGAMLTVWLAELQEREFKPADGRRLGETINKFSQHLIQFDREHPGDASRVAPLVAGAAAAVDYGKLREAASMLAESGGAAAQQAFGAILANPAALANCLGLAPPFINTTLRVLAKALQDLDISPEVMAAALFNLLADIDQREVGRVLTLASTRLNQLHAGNMILGGNEPYFRAVLRDFLAGVATTADWREITAAATALGEDLETVVQVAWEAAWRSPQTAETTAAAVAAGLTTFTRTATVATKALVDLPEETFRQAVEGWRVQTDPTDSARLVNALISLAARVMADEEARRRLGQTLTEIDLARLAEVGREATAAAQVAWQADVQRREALQPEQLGRRVNQWLTSFNRRMENRPDGVRQWFARFFGEIRPGELERALRLTLNGFTKALFTSAGRGMSVLRPLGASARQALSCWLGNLRRRLFRKHSAEA